MPLEPEALSTLPCLPPLSLPSVDARPGHRRGGGLVSAFPRVLRLARTIADLAAADQIDPANLAEVLQYRPAGGCRE
ncbi:MAG: hypothetical protein HYY05_08700 [Chloroflexi bacterium]|nr:hypothetical protein [Chloroflexota bacterium]